MKTPRELKSLRDKMRAIQSGDYDVEADNPKIVRCWERLTCDKQDCPAYGRLRCWSIAGTCCHGEIKGTFAQKIDDCRECVVYKESCGDDIGELIEAFNLMVRDIKFNFSEKVRIDQEKARNERLLEMSDMVAGVAHETRNPLHSIGIAASFLKKKYQDELMNEFLGIIEEEVRKLNDLTSLFLNFSNPSPLQLESCDINHIIEAGLAEVAADASRQHIAVNVEKEDPMPRIMADSSRIKDCIVNLVENALEASPGGSIKVSTRTNKGVIMISVRDNGPGISAEEQKKIFKPFYTTKTSGPGLGLAIVERSIKELQGRVEVESKPGKGALFTLFLPLPDQRPR